MKYLINTVYVLDGTIDPNRWDPLRYNCRRNLPLLLDRSTKSLVSRFPYTARNRDLRKTEEMDGIAAGDSGRTTGGTAMIADHERQPRAM
jgi:hypothetical protein